MENNIYKDVLLNFSYSELIPFVQKESLEFSRLSTGKDISFSNLVDYLTVQGGRHSLYKKKFRHTFIDKMTIEQLSDLLAKRDINVESVSYSTYETLKDFSDRNFDEFCDFLGLDAENNVTKVFKDTYLQEPYYPSYPYQRDITKKVTGLIERGEDRRALIHLPTGSGKTRTAMNIVCEHLRNNESGVVIWLADKAELCEQAQAEFGFAWKSLGNRRISSYSFYDRSDLSLSGINSGFVVMGLQKLKSYEDNGNDLIYRELQNHVSLVVFDEAHKAIAKTYSKSVNQLININKNAFVLGLTATPGRRFSIDDSEEDEKLALFFKNNKVTMKVDGYKSPITYLVESGYLSRPNFISLEYVNENYEIDLSNFSGREHEITAELANIDERNRAIISTVLEEYNNGSHIIIFACDVQHAVDLAFTLNCLGVEACSLDSKNDDSLSRKHKIDSFKSGAIRVLVNYEILTTGFDAPIINVAIVARPTTSLVLYMQMVGRALRGKLSGGNVESNIYTVVDDIPEFNNITKAFEHWDEQWEEV